MRTVAIILASCFVAGAAMADSCKEQADGKKLAGAATKLLGRHRTRTNLSHLGAQFLSHRTQVTACIARFLAVVPRGGIEPPTP